MEPVIPAPAAAFSPFAITKSIPDSRLIRGTRSSTISRPGLPTMSPMKSSLSTPGTDCALARRAANFILGPRGRRIAGRTHSNPNRAANASIGRRIMGGPCGRSHAPWDRAWRAHVEACLAYAKCPLMAGSINCLPP